MNTFKITAGENLWISVDGNPEKFSRCIPNQTYTVTSKCLLAGKGTQSIYGIEGDFTKVSGNALTLIDCDDPTSVTLIDSQFFNGTNKGLFTSTASTGCTAFEDASALELNSASVPTSAYRSMFQGCPALTKAPALPGGTVGQEAYADMFNGCEALSVVPSSLPAATAPEGVYQNMFNNCTALETAPSISATSVSKNACNGMFKDCTALVTPPDSLTADITGEACYKEMFMNCARLETAPTSLPATTLTKDCYNSMFKATKINATPSIAASTLAEGCCESMFENCGSLKTVSSALNASTLETGCYKKMFQNCSSLEGPISIGATTAPSPALTGDMFSGSGTSHPVISHSGDIIKIKASTNGVLWNQANAGIDATYWEVPSTVLLLSGNVDEFTTFKFSYGANIEVSDDGLAWTSLSAGIVYSVSDGKLYVRGKSGSTPVAGFAGSFTKVSGNIMSLVDYENVHTVALNESQFRSGSLSLFQYATTLIDASELELPRTTLAKACYKCMFEGCSSLIIPPALPATTLAEGCYGWMFKDCSSLINAPALPATTLFFESYAEMFRGCTSLEGNIDLSHVITTPSSTNSEVSLMFTNAGTSHPKMQYLGEDKVKITLPLANRAAWCMNAEISNYYWESDMQFMIFSESNHNLFYFAYEEGANVEVSPDGINWSSLDPSTLSPSSSNGKLAVRAKTGSTPMNRFGGMYDKVEGNIMSLIDYSNISTAILSDNQFFSTSEDKGLFTGNWFLKDVRGVDLTPTTLALNCYRGMFTNCSAITEVPIIRAIHSARYCFCGMFSACTSITDASSIILPDNLTEACYAWMFSGCTSLITAPVFPTVTTLALVCYDHMFYGCTSLTGPVRIPAPSPYSSGTTTACNAMFLASATSRPSTPTDYDKVYVGDNVADWEGDNTGIYSPYWTVELIS